MTTLIAFAPNNQDTPPFSTVMQLDGNYYNAAVTWNVYAQRWYLTLSDQSGNVIWNGALVGSPTAGNIYLAPGLFETSTLLYRSGTNNFEITP